MRVGWYVHHHGAGHRTRASVVGAELVARGADVTLLGSALDRVSAREKSLRTVLLAMDAPLPEGADEVNSDVTVGGTMHWAPLGHNGFQERMTTIARWIQVEEPDVFVVDVSCEVAVMVRLLGVPVVVVAQPGDRRDGAHSAAFDSASAILAPWPSWATENLWQRPRTGRADGPASVVAVGGISGGASVPPLFVGDRSADATPVAAVSPWAAATAAHPAIPATGCDRPRGLMLTGSEGFDDPDLPATIADAVPEVDWTVAGGGTWIHDVHQELARADIVVTHAGQNAIADVAGSGTPAVVVPQRRPFDEQAHLAGVLSNSGMAHVVAGADLEGTDWRELVQEVRRSGGRGWEKWGCHGAAARAASLVEVVSGV